MPLKLEKISKRFGNKWILRDFSLEVNPGEIFGLLGASASGKTTALRLVAGTEAKDSGKIDLHGKNLSGVKFFGDRQNQFSWKSLFKGSNQNATETSAKRYAEFENILNEATGILLLDDPFIGFDQKLRDTALHKLRQTATEKNLIVVFATNNFAEAFEVCDRIGILHDGEIIQTGTPRELYENPGSVAAAAALGRHNLIPARRVSFNNQPIPEFQTLTGDHRLLTGKTEKFSLGAITDSVTLAIRPEHISISFGASFPEDNLLKATIVAVQYCGATTRIKLNANGLLLEALVLRLVGLKTGDECMVGLPPDRILILKD